MGGPLQISQSSVSLRFPKTPAPKARGAVITPFYFRGFAPTLKRKGGRMTGKSGNPRHFRPPSKQNYALGVTRTRGTEIRNLVLYPPELRGRKTLLYNLLTCLATPSWHPFRGVLFGRGLLQDRQVSVGSDHTFKRRPSLFSHFFISVFFFAISANSAVKCFSSFGRGPWLRCDLCGEIFLEQIYPGHPFVTCSKSSFRSGGDPTASVRSSYECLQRRGRVGA